MVNTFKCTVEIGWEMTLIKDLKVPRKRTFKSILFLVWKSKKVREIAVNRFLISRGDQVPKISLRNVCHKSPVFWDKNWESCVTKSRFFSGPQTKFVTLTKHCPFQHLRSWYKDPRWMSRVGHSVDQGETMFSEKTTCRNLLFASHVLKTRRSRWWFRWFKHEFARGISLTAVFKVFSAGR